MSKCNDARRWRCEDRCMSAPSEWTVRRIATVTSSRHEAVDDDWGDVMGTITLAPPFDERSVAGLEEFSHIEVLFLFDRVDPAAVCESRAVRVATLGGRRSG